MDIAGSTQVAYNVRTGHGFDLTIGVMIAGNSGRPGGGIYNDWQGPSPQQRLQGVHPGHRTQGGHCGSLACRFGTHCATSA